MVFVALVTLGIWFAVRHNAQSNGQDAHKLQVTASYYPLYDFAKAVGGDKVQVTTMTPPGAEPHDYEPSPQALIAAQKSAVFIYNGGQLEPWVTNFVKEYRHTAVRASDGINLVLAEDTDNPGRVADPHFWLDPILAQQIVDSIEQGFAKADPANKDVFAQNATAYKAKLTQLNADYQQGLANCQLNTVITAHDAFSYMAARYNLQVIAIAGMSPDEEPSAGRLAQLSQLVREQGIQYILFERLVSPRLADTIATETGAHTLVFDPIEGLAAADQKQGKDYLSIQHENLKNLRTALACQ